ncbi:hypothetical protein HP398_00630 [Brevibacillus sp. HB1.4B]|uniref:hypothetical protein n=1 Tax=Brevibacillus sp. HB1.4B TaxID=2738845 RepID=UPI00156AF83D|nr:hypothetical protein [Brevibacillus sp. HB1.4B]NRS14937.1 hypothetical protein [Brevibacillus sp. HB1.4B]
MLGIKLKYWVVVLLVPIIINVLVAIPNPLAIQVDSVWIGFFGNYAGGIVGAFVALLIARKQTEIALEQLKDEKRNRDEEKMKQQQLEEKQRKDTIKIIHLFIYEEIKTNIEELNPTFLTALQEWSIGKLKNDHMINFEFDFTIYNENKYDLVRYDDPNIEEVVEVYRIFTMLEKYKKVNDISIDLASYFFDELTRWKESFNIKR